MKLEQLIVQYLYQNKSVSLQEIGNFHIAPEVIIPQESDKDFQLPDGAINFEYDLKVPADEGLVTFIVQKTRKIKSLAASDLESYTSLNKQFLNIGKPLIIEGLGTLQKNQAGKYEFSQSNHFNIKTEALPTEIREKADEEISFSTPIKKASGKKNNKNWLVVFVLLFFILGAVALVYYFNLPKKETVDLPIKSAKNDTVLPVVNKDTVAIPIDGSVASVQPLPSQKDGYSFKVVIKSYTNLTNAKNAFNRLKSYGHPVILTTRDSVNYHIKIPFTNSLADTSRIKDSLNKFYAAKTYIDLN